MTTHRQITAPDADKPQCRATVQFFHRGYWDNEVWEVYYCPRCAVYVSLLGGGAVVWHYTLADEAAERLTALTAREEAAR